MFETSQHIYLIFEYFEDGDLKKCIEEVKHFNEELSLKILMQVIQGLKHLHSLGIIHRDIKPENIFVKLKFI